MAGISIFIAAAVFRFLTSSKVVGCTTGNSYHYSNNDSYYAYTDFESIDITIANHYKATAATANLPFASLHLGAGAHSDADSVGLGQRYISYRARQSGDSQYGNAIEPIQDAGQVYDMLMERVNLLCSGSSNAAASAAVCRSCGGIFAS